MGDFHCRVLLRRAALAMCLGLAPMAEAVAEEPVSVVMQQGHWYRGIGGNFSADGKLLLTTAEDKSVRLWDVASGRLLRVVSGPFGFVAAIFSPDASQFYTVDSAGALQFRSTATGEIVKDLAAAGEEGSAAVVLSPDGKTLAIGGASGTVMLWATASGKLANRLKGSEDSVQSLAYSPDGKRLAAGSWGGKVRVWPAGSAKSQLVLDNKLGATAKQLQFSADGKLLAARSDDGFVTLWNLADGKALGILKVDGVAITAVAVSADGRQVITGDSGGAVRAWDAANAAALKSVDVHKQGITSLVLRLDGVVAVTGAEDGSIGRTDLQAGKVLDVAGGGGGNVISLVRAPDGAVLSVPDGDAPRLWDPQSGKELRQLGEPVMSVGLREACGGGQLVLTSADSGEEDATPHWQIWDMAAGRQLRSFVAADADCDRNHPVIATRDGATITIADTITGKQLQQIAVSQAEVVTLRFSADGGSLLVVGETNGAQVLEQWSTLTWQRVATVPGGENIFGNVDLARDGSTLLAFDGGSDDEAGTHAIWDIKSGKKSHDITGHKDYETDATLCGDGAYALSSSWDSTAMIWNVRAAKLHRPIAEFSGFVMSVACAPDSTVFATGDEFGHVMLWSILPDGNKVKPIRPADDARAAVSRLVFSPDQTLLYSLDYEQTLRVLDVKTGRERARIGFFPQGAWAMQTPEGFFAASGEPRQHMALVRGTRVVESPAGYGLFNRPDLVAEKLRGDPDGKVAREKSALDLTQIK